MAYSQIDRIKKERTQKQTYLALFWKISDNDIIELARSLYAANISFYRGRKTKFIEIERELELFFNKKVKRPHNKITRISERVNVAPFLDFLKDSYINDLESRL